MADQNKPDKDKGKSGAMSKKLKLGGIKKLKPSGLTPSKLAPKASGAFSNIKSNITDSLNSGFSPVSDTDSPKIDGQCKELDQSAAFLKTILKGMSKQQKHLKLYMESGEDLSAALLTYHNIVIDNPLLAPTLDLVLKFEESHKNALNELFQHTSKVQEELTNFIEQTVPPAKLEKKKFDAQRRLLDAANTKLARFEKEQSEKTEKARDKTKEVDKEKLKELNTDKEQKKVAYLQQGEKSYHTLLNAVETTKYNNVIKLTEYMEGYSGYLNKSKTDIVDIQKNLSELSHKAKDEQRQFKLSSSTGPKNVWAPESIAGNTKRVFAMNYQQVIDRDKPSGNILPFLDEAFKYLEENGLTTTGIFRVSAPKPALDSLRDKLDKGQSVSFDDVHMASGLLKLFLRELPAPLLTYELYPEWMSVSELPSEKARVDKIREIVKKLPEANRILLERLMGLCIKILHREEENMMTVENLAIVLCPSILYDQDPNPLTMVQDIQKANSIMVVILHNYEEIFGKKIERPSNMKKTKSSKPPSSVPPPLPPGTPPPPLTNPPPRPEPTAPTDNPQLPKDKRPLPDKPMKRTESTRSDQEPREKESKDNKETQNVKVDVAPSSPMKTETPAAKESSPEASANEEDDVEEKIDNKIIITLLTPPLSYRKLLDILEGSKPTSKHYYKFLDLWQTTYTFTNAVFHAGDSDEDAMAMSSAFQGVARAIKNMLANIKEYAQLLPNEASKRILDAANKVRPHIKDLISYVRSHNSGKDLDKTNLLETTRKFVIGSYLIFLNCYRSSQMDEISQAGMLCNELIAKLKEALLIPNSEELASVILNNLQHYILTLTSLLRARLPDVTNEKLQTELAGIIEKAEQGIGEIFDEAREMLEQNTLTNTPELEEKVNNVKLCVLKTLSLRPDLEEVVASVPISIQLEAAIEQFRAIKELQQDEDPEVIQSFVNGFDDLADSLLKLTPILETPSSNPTEWMSACQGIIDELSDIKQIVEQLLPTIEDESLHQTVEAYLQSLTHYIVQYKICSTAAMFGIEVKNLKFINPIMPLRDLAFLTYSFTYSFKEACSTSN